MFNIYDIKALRYQAAAPLIKEADAEEPMTSKALFKLQNWILSCWSEVSPPQNLDKVAQPWSFGSTARSTQPFRKTRVSFRPYRNWVLLASFFHILRQHGAASSWGNRWLPPATKRAGFNRWLTEWFAWSWFKKPGGLQQEWKEKMKHPAFRKAGKYCVKWCLQTTRDIIGWLHSAKQHQNPPPQSRHHHHHHHHHHHQSSVIGHRS